MTSDEKSRLGIIAQQVRTFGEILERFEEKISPTDVVTISRLRGMYEMAEFMADWIQMDERNPKLQIIARTGSTLSELVLPHILAHATQLALLAEVDEVELMRHIRGDRNGGSESED